MGRATLRSLLAHKLRLMLTALAVVLGVGFIAGTYVLTDTMGAAFDELFEETSRGVDVFIRDASEFEAAFGGSREPIDASVLDLMRDVEGIDVVSGSVQGYAQLVDKEGEAVTPGGAPTLGFSWGPEPLNPMRLRDGAPPEGPDEVVIDLETAAATDLEVGDRVDIITLRDPRSFEIAGVATFGSASNLGGATLALFDLPTAQELFDKEGKLDSIEIAAEEGISETELRDRIQTVLPEGIEAETATKVAQEQSSSIQENLGFFKTALLVFASVALFVGAFLIFNTFSITVAQRTREFALLRALGASGFQVMGSVVIEASIVGLVAAALGLGAGILIALGLNALLGAFGIELPQGALRIEARTIVVSVAVGLGVTVVSSLIPARRAARISPMEAMRESAPSSYRPGPRRLVVGGALTAAGIAVLLIGLFGDVSGDLTYVGVGALVVFVGVAVLAPILAGPLARAIGAPLERSFGVPGSLARRNADRNPKRTAATAAALMIGLALVGFVGIFAASSKASVDRTLDAAMRADFVIQSKSLFSQVISPRLAEALKERAELAAVAPFRTGQFRQSGERRFIVGTDPGALPATADIGVTSGELRDLDDGDVFLFEGLASELDVEMGDRITVEFAATGRTTLDVVGTFDDKTLVGADHLVSLETYDANLPERVDSSVLIKAAETVEPGEARRAIEQIAAGYPNVEVSNQAEAKEKIAGQIDQLLGLVTALLALALVIALLGITNTLALSVYERTLELGLLRAVGMSRSQTRSMIRWEAVIIVLIGGLLGLIVGIGFGWALVRALADEGITEFALPGGQLLVYLAAAVVAGLIAAIPPARRAARLNILDAIATE